MGDLLEKPHIGGVETLVFTHKSADPCLLVRQVNQFEKLPKSNEKPTKDPCQLVWQVNQFAS